MGVQKLTGDNLKVVLAKFSTFNLGCFVMYANAQCIQARPGLELKTWPRLCPVSFSSSVLIVAATLELFTPRNKLRP